MKAYVLINIRAGAIKEVLKNLRRLDNIIEANMTFGPYDAVVVIEADSLAKIGSIIYSDVQPIPGVLETLTCLAVDI